MLLINNRSLISKIEVRFGRRAGKASERHSAFYGFRAIADEAYELIGGLEDGRHENIIMVHFLTHNGLAPHYNGMFVYYCRAERLVTKQAIFSLDDPYFSIFNEVFYGLDVPERLAYDILSEVI